MIQSLDIRCPHCASSLDGELVAKGERFSCPGCDQVLRAEPSADELCGYAFVEYIKTLCKHCKRRQHVRKAYLGQNVVCTDCGKKFRAELKDKTAPRASAHDPSDSTETAEFVTNGPTLSDLETQSELSAHKHDANPLQHDKQIRAELQARAAEIDQLKADMAARREGMEQLQISLQIERKANAHTMQELISVRKERELLQKVVRNFRIRMSAEPEASAELPRLRQELEEACAARKQLEAEQFALVEEANRLRDAARTLEDSLGRAQSGQLTAESRLARSLQQQSGTLSADERLALESQWQRESQALLEASEERWRGVQTRAEADRKEWQQHLDAARKNFEQQRASLQRVLDGSRQEAAVLRQELEVLRNQVEGVTEENTRLTAELERLMTEAQEREERTRTEAARQAAALQEAKQQRDVASVRNIELAEQSKKQLDQAAQRESSLNARIDEINKLFSDAKTEAAARQENFTACQLQLEEEKAQLRQGLEESRERAVVLTQERASLESQLKDLEQVHVTLATEHGKLETQARQAEERSLLEIGKLSNARDAAERHNEEQEGQIQSLTSQNEDHRKRDEQAKAGLAALQAELKDAQEAHQDLVSKLGKSEEESQKIVQANRALELKLTAAQDAVRDLQSRIELTEKNLAEENSRRQAENLENNQKLESAGAQWKELTEQHRSAQQQLERGHELETQLRTELAALHQDLDAAVELQQELQASLENANQTLKREETRIANDRQECERRIQVAEERVAEEQTAAMAAHQEAATAREELNSIWNQIESLSQARNRAAAERDRFKKVCEDAQAGQKPALEQPEADLEKVRGEHRAALAQVAELTDQLAQLRQRVEQPNQKLRNARR